MELRINGVIDDLTYAEFPALIKGAEEDIDLQIDSPGGSVLTGLKIIAAIQDARVGVYAHVSTIAASMAGYIALACDHVEISSTAVLMLHNVMVDFSGNKEDLQGVMEALQTFDKIVHNIVDSHCKDKGFSARIDGGDVWLSGPEAAELFDNIEVVEPAKATALAATVNFAALVAKAKIADSAQKVDLTPCMAAVGAADDTKDDKDDKDDAKDDAKDGEDGADEPDDQTDDSAADDKGDKKAPYQVSASLMALLKQADELE